MKLKRFNESVHEDYVEILQDKIKNDKKIINRFEFYFDNMSNTFEWDSDNITIFATPYWEENLNLPIDILIDDTDRNIVFELKELTSQKDVDNTINYYYEIIDSLTLKLNKISELNSVIPIILNKLSIIKFDNIIIKSIDDIKKYDIDELVKLYNYLYKQYPEIFLAKNFNI